MAVAGRLAEFSLPEIFQLLEQGNKTGLLTLIPTELPQNWENHYIWLREGQIVAAANRLDNQGLLRMFKQRNWLSDADSSKIPAADALNKPLGVLLKLEGIIQPEHLKIMFYMQVMQQVCALFQLQDGDFHFENKVSLPLLEMTGLSAPATEVTLAGLRVLKKWDNLLDKLPDVTSGLIPTIEGKPHLHLNQEEWLVWEFVDGSTSLRKTAQALSMPFENLQRIAFRLIAVNLCEEIPLVEMKSPENIKAELSLELEGKESNSPTNLSESFLQNLVGFLKAKA